jgi:parvulin-like peptidyl-prolyl isomerase
MGVVSVRDLHPKLQAVVRKLKVGEFSRPVPLGGEWVIVKLEERMPAERKTFEEVQGQVIASLRRRKAAELKLTLPERWLRQGKVQVLDASLRKSLTLPKGAKQR